MPSGPCEALRAQGYQFFSDGSSAAVKPCLWCKRSLRGGEKCYKHQFYGIVSHRCIQMTPTLRCTHACLFCWRSYEHEVEEDLQLPPEFLVDHVKALQKKALSGYKPSPYVTKERFAEALAPRHVAISLSGEPTLYGPLPRLLELFHREGYSTFLVSNGTLPHVLEKCRPTQLYVSLNAPEKETYQRVCQPKGDTWESVIESLNLLGGRRSAIRITLVRGLNDGDPAGYSRLVRDSGALFVEVKGYMHLGYSRKRLTRDHMPPYAYVREFAEKIAAGSGYSILDENVQSRVVCLGRVE